MTSRVPNIRVPMADGRVLSICLASVLLAACATSPEPPAPTVVRTRAPQGYEKTINNYMAFRVRPQKNSRIVVAPPEPGDCPIDGTPQSIRGWVVPVQQETFNGEPSGKDAIRITAKPYWFWFNGDTIAGITPRADLCPGIVSAFDEPKPRATTTVPVEAPVAPAAARVDASDAAHAPAPPARSAKSAKKKPASSAGGKQTSPAVKAPQSTSTAKPPG